MSVAVDVDPVQFVEADIRIMSRAMFLCFYQYVRYWVKIIFTFTSEMRRLSSAVEQPVAAGQVAGAIPAVSFLHFCTVHTVHLRNLKFRNLG